MIGHVLDSGAIVLGCAPALAYADEYVLIARVPGGYVTASVLLRDLPAPTTWIDCVDHAASPDGTGKTLEQVRAEAIGSFCEITGLPISTTEASVARAEALLTSRGALPAP